MIDQMRASIPGFVYRGDGRMNVNRQPGYQIVYQARIGGKTVYGKRVLLVPGYDPPPRAGLDVTLRAERSRRGAQRERGRPQRRAEDEPALAALRHRAAVNDLRWEEFERVDMRVGRIVEVEEFPEARRPAWKLRVDFGPEVGVRRSSAQITNYTREELDGRLVIGVVNFPPKQIGPVRSECLVLGTYTRTPRACCSPSPTRARRRRLGGRARGAASREVEMDMLELWSLC